MKRFLTTTLMLLFCSSVNSAVLTADSGWSSFYFGDTGSSWSDSFSVTLTEASTLTVTDAFLSGDIFQVFVDGSSLGFTSTVTTGSSIGNDYAGAAASAAFSTGSWVLSAGSYIISGIVSASPYAGGGAALRVDTGVSAVPVPAALWFFGPALVGLIGLRKKSKSA